mmetsp:Transcript_48390/g.117792  ORF Transcript_48390/g.117792 Transcript_48390/m.117792 type:complete len:225 (-) Transcript_48390:42-716(-)
MRVLGAAHLAELAPANLQHLAASVGPLRELGRGPVLLRRVVVVPVVDGLLELVGLVVLHEEGTLVVILLHEHHVAPLLLALAHGLVLGHHLLVRHGSPADHVQLLLLELLPLLAVALQPLELPQPPLVVLLLLVPARVRVLLDLALLLVPLRLLLLLKLDRHDVPRLLLPLLLPLLLSRLYLLVLLVDLVPLLDRGARGLGDKNRLDELLRLLLLRVRLVLPLG